MSGLVTPSLTLKTRRPQWTPGEYREWDISASQDSSRLVFASDLFGTVADQYRTIAKRLELRCTGRRLLITSPGPRDGKSTSASNLAWALSDRGRSVLLLELDLRRPSFSTIFGRSPSLAGIEDVLRGEAEAEEAICRIRGTSLHIAAVDEPQVMAARLVQDKRLVELLEWGNKNFDWVVLDTPPVFPVSDVVELASQADPVVMVVKARSTRASLARRAIENLGGTLKYVIFNGSDANVRSSYYYSEYRAIQP